MRYFCSFISHIQHRLFGLSLLDVQSVGNKHFYNSSSFKKYYIHLH